VVVEEYVIKKNGGSLCGGAAHVCKMQNAKEKKRCKEKSTLKKQYRMPKKEKKKNQLDKTDAKTLLG